MSFFCPVGALWFFLPVILNPAAGPEPEVVTETHSAENECVPLVPILRPSQESHGATAST